MEYLSKNDLLDLHAYAITRYGGRLGIASHDRLMMALNSPRQVLFETELYPDIPSKAAALLFLILKNRPFVSGNEATAVLAMLRFLAINGAALDDRVGDDTIAQLVQSVMQSKIDREGLERWLREHLQTAG